MKYVGLDVGTGFVKCVTENKQLIFPSLYAYRDSNKWESQRGRVEAVGYPAKYMKKYPDAVIIRPVMEGKPIDDAGFSALVENAAKVILKNSFGHDNNNSKDNYEICNHFADSIIVAGLPYDAKADKEHLRNLIKKRLNPKRVVIVPQVLGTLINKDMKNAIVVSIGQGTTEIVAFDDLKPILGTSLSQATDFITQSLGEFSYLDFPRLYDDHKTEVSRSVEKLSHILANRLLSIQNQFSWRYPVIASGGGILIHGMRENLQKRLKKKNNIALHVPENPVMSNAQGLYMLARKTME